MILAITSCPPACRNFGNYKLCKKKNKVCMEIVTKDECSFVLHDNYGMRQELPL